MSTSERLKRQCQEDKELMPVLTFWFGSLKGFVSKCVGKNILWLYYKSKCRVGNIYVA